MSSLQSFRMFRAFLAWQSRVVFRRHALVYFRGWKTGLLPPVMEPVIFFVAFGLGLRGHIGTMTWQGQDLDYTAYVAPALIAYTAFTTSFYEGLYSSYVRMFYQKTWDGMLATQVELEHILCGEILFAACRASVNSTLVAIVLATFHAFGFVALELSGLFFVPVFAFFGGCAFASFALVFTAIVPGIEHINYPVFLIAIPLGLLSNTYFPIPTTHAVLRAAVAINPLAHMAETLRSLFIQGVPGPHFLTFAASSVVLLMVAMPLVAKLMRKRVLGD